MGSCGRCSAGRRSSRSGDIRPISHGYAWLSSHEEYQSGDGRDDDHDEDGREAAATEVAFVFIFRLVESVGVGVFCVHVVMVLIDVFFSSILAFLKEEVKQHRVGLCGLVGLFRQIL